MRGARASGSSAAQPAIQKTHFLASICWEGKSEARLCESSGVSTELRRCKLHSMGPTFLVDGRKHDLSVGLELLRDIFLVKLGHTPAEWRFKNM